MEPFSVTAAAITLCPLIIQTARQLRNVAKSVRYAQRELEDLTVEMDIFSSFYNQFMQVTKERMKKKGRAASARAQLISWAENAKFDFEKLSKRVDALSRDPVYEHSITDMVSAHCKWYLNRNHLKYLRYMLVVARQSMVGFIHICHIKRLDKLLARLRIGITSEERLKIEREEGMPLNEYMIHCEQEVKELREQASLTKDIAKEYTGKISSKQSRSQNEDYSQHTEQLLSFSEVVDRDIKRTLHRSRPSQSNSSSSSSSFQNKGTSRVDSPSQSSGHYVHIQRQSVVDQPHERFQHTGPDPAGTDATRPKKAPESMKADPNHVPPLRVPVRDDDTVNSRPHPDTNTHASTKTPEAPPTSRSESNTGEIESNSADGSKSEMEDEQIEVAYMIDGKWRPIGAFTGTEPRHLREKRQRGSSSQDRGRSKG